MFFRSGDGPRSHRLYHRYILVMEVLSPAEGGKEDSRTPRRMTLSTPAHLPWDLMRDRVSKAAGSLDRGRNL